MLRELGLDLPDDVEVRVWDSNAASRYLVLPERPQGTEAMSEADLAVGDPRCDDRRRESRRTRVGGGS